FAAISEYLTIKNKENSQLKCISLKLRVLIYIEGVFELLTHPLSLPPFPENQSSLYPKMSYLLLSFYLPLKTFLLN
ncbi:hypothetical protein, partial [Bacteroides acidifaciens]|uniref:hypothetical protein n=1 Tax=Bacteroides acidifaciens TaxID=85831 RepID=UPI001ADDB4D7